MHRLTARILEYRAPLDQIVEVASRGRRHNLMDVDQLIQSEVWEPNHYRAGNRKFESISLG
jgi:hypothetical protein